MSAAAARRMRGARSLKTAGTMLDPMGASPMASDTIPMVLAVNWPAHDPADGRQACARASSSSVVASPAKTLPMVSYVSATLVSRPFQCPGRAAPPCTNTARTLQRTMPIIRPGRFLSHPPMAKMPSH